MYTVNEVSKMLNLNPHTIRYYTNEGLIPNLGRGKDGCRLFSEENVNYIRGVVYMRNCGMSISSIRAYMELVKKGEATIREQYLLILEQSRQLEEKIGKLLESRDYMEKKLKIYRDYMASVGMDAKE